MYLLNKKIIIFWLLLFFLLSGKSVLAKEKITSLSLNIPSSLKTQLKYEQGNYLYLRTQNESFTFSGKTNPNSKVYIVQVQNNLKINIKADQDGNFQKKVVIPSGKKTEYYIYSVGPSMADSDLLYVMLDNSVLNESKSLNNNNLNMKKKGSQINLNKTFSYPDSELVSSFNEQKFLIKDIGIDNKKNYRVLMIPDNNSQEKFFTIIKKNGSKQLKQGDIIVIDGKLNQRGTILQDQINTGISSKFLNDKVVVVKTFSYKVDKN